MKNSTLLRNLIQATLFSFLFTFFGITNSNAQDTLTIGEQEYDEFYDHDNLGGPVYIGEVPALVIPAAANTKSAQVLKSGSVNLKSATASDPIWPEEGAVHIEKTAESTATPGRWKINLKVEGKNIQSTTDVVLVIDDSGSMGTTKMNNAKNAAKNFVDSLLTGTTNIRIAIVTINGGGSIGVPQLDKNFTNNISQLKNAINAISSGGGTNLQGGFYMARTLMVTSSANNKSVILLSDGYPTYSYESTVTSSQPTCTGYSWSHTRDDIEENYLNVTSSTYTNVIGNGSYFSYTLFTKYSSNCGTFNAGNHGVPTEYEAGLLMGNGVDIYTIGFEVTGNTDAEDVLEDSQNKGYYPATSSTIDGIYDEIRSNIAYAASNAILTDPMSTYVVLESAATPTWGVAPSSADVVVSKGSVSFTQNGWVLNDPDDLGSGNSTIKKWKITWNIGTVNENPGDEMYYYINMAPNTNPTILYDANEQTYMDYTDVNGNTDATQQTNNDFTIPKVSGGKGSIEIFYYLTNASGQPINSSGTVVSGPEYAYRIPQDGNASSYFEDGGSTALEVNTVYNVSGETPYSSSDGFDYTVHSNYSTTQSIMPTSTDPNKEAWFGYVKVVCTLTSASASATTIQCNGGTSDITLTAIGGNLPITFELKGFLQLQCLLKAIRSKICAPLLFRGLLMKLATVTIFLHFSQ